MNLGLSLEARHVLRFGPRASPREMMTLRAARNMGCDVAEAEPQRIGDWDVLVSRRYDRAADGGMWRRLHQEDLCQALSVPPAKKYQHRDGGPGTARIGLTADESGATVEHMRAGMVQAFEEAGGLSVELGTSGREIAERVIRGVRMLPLVGRD